MSDINLVNSKVQYYFVNKRMVVDLQDLIAYLAKSESASEHEVAKKTLNALHTDLARVLEELS